jgi:type IV pilus assembly protein PilM
MPSLNVSLGRRSGGNVVGLDIQPGHVAAVQAHVNGSIVAEHAAAMALPADIVREGEVLDEGVLGETLRELFQDSGLSSRVRIGVANQRTVLRTLELPPVTDRKELAAAVRFQAQDQVPMPLDNAVLDFHSLGVHDTPAGPRQQVVLVAAQRDMVQRLLAAVRKAGLRPEGVDLSAFALIRSFYRHDPEHDGRVLYLNVDGLTNMAIAEGAVCRFTRVVGGGFEAMAGELAERRGIPVTEARELIAAADLAAVPELSPEPATLEHAEPNPSEPDAEETATDDSSQPEAVPANDDVRTVLQNGIREIAGEVRNSLEFHRSQEGGGDVALVVLSGAALDVPGFADALQAELGVAVARETVGVAHGLTGTPISPQRLAIAAGLAVEEAPR